jgi:predicted enzyme related to lactoylglutathione lyase
MMASLLCITLLASGTVLAQTTPSPLRVSMISLGVTDMVRSMKFYGETLGLQLVRETEPGQFAIFRAGEITITLNRPLAQASKQIVGAVEIIFNVDSVDASHRFLAAKSCIFKVAPHEIVFRNVGRYIFRPRRASAHSSRPSLEARKTHLGQQVGRFREQAAVDVGIRVIPPEQSMVLLSHR